MTSATRPASCRRRCTSRSASPSLTYVLISLGVFGTLTVDEVVGYGETAIAEAARPALGRRGLHDHGDRRAAGDRVVGQRDALRLGRVDGDAGRGRASFRRSSGAGSRLGAHAGLLITSAIVLVVANLVDLSAIASVGSACSLMIFLLVGIAGYRLRSETGALGAIVLVGIAATGDRARLLRGGHAAECSGDVRRHRRDRGAGRGPRRHLEADAAGGPAGISRRAGPIRWRLAAAGPQPGEASDEQVRRRSRRLTRPSSS